MNKAAMVVKHARKITRPTALEFIEGVLDEFIEFHGDRNYADDKAVVGGVGLLNGRPVTAIGIQKGHTLEENVARNFGTAHPEGYRKALRLMRQAEKFGRPIVTFINTSGAYCGIGAEERGQGEAIARNLFEMFGLRVPIVSILIGEGGSGGALALAVADEVWMLENGMYAILSPEGFASILWRDSSRSEEAAALMRLTADDLIKNQVIDRIVPEAEEGIEVNFSYTTSYIREHLIQAFREKERVPADELLKARYERYRKYGEFEG